MITLSRNGVLVSIYRFFKKRQIALKGSSFIEKRQLTKSLESGAKLDLCPIMRMILLWGPFLVFPAWCMLYVILPTGMAIIILGTVGLISLGAYTAWARVGFDLLIALQTLGMLIAGLALITVCAAGILFIAFLGVKAFSAVREYVEDRLPQRPRRFGGYRKPRQRSETLEALELWWEGLHDKFCAFVQIR